MHFKKYVRQYLVSPMFTALSYTSVRSLQMVMEVAVIWHLSLSVGPMSALCDCRSVYVIPIPYPTVTRGPKKSESEKRKVYGIPPWLGTEPPPLLLPFIPPLLLVSLQSMCMCTYYFRRGKQCLKWLSSVREVVLQPISSTTVKRAFETPATVQWCILTGGSFEKWRLLHFQNVVPRDWRHFLRTDQISPLVARLGKARTRGNSWSQRCNGIASPYITDDSWMRCILHRSFRVVHCTQKHDSSCGYAMKIMEKHHIKKEDKVALFNCFSLQIVNRSMPQLQYVMLFPHR